MNPFARNPSGTGPSSARPYASSSKPHSPSSKTTSHPKSAKPPKPHLSHSKPKPKPKPLLNGTKMKHQTISASDLFGHNFKRSSASPRPSVITTSKPSGSTHTSTYSASNFSSAHSNASSTSSHAPVPQPKPAPAFERDFSLSPPPPLSPPPVSAPEVPAPPPPVVAPVAAPSTIISIPKIKLRLGGFSANSTPRPSPPLPLPQSGTAFGGSPVASTSTLPKSGSASTSSTHPKKKKLSGRPEVLPVFVSAADTLLTAGTSSRPNIHRVFSPSVPPSPTASNPPPSAIMKAEAAMKGKGKAYSNPVPLVGVVASKSKGKGKGKGKGRARDESVDLGSPTKPSTSLPYSSIEAGPSTFHAPKAASPRPLTSSKKIRALFEDSDDSLTSLPSEFQSSDSSSSDDGLDSDGKPDVLFISSKQRRMSQALSSSEDNSDLDSDSDSGSFSSTTMGAEDDMDEDEDEMMREEEDLFRREGRRRHGGGKRKGGWENVRDREGDVELSSWAGESDGFSHNDLDDEDDDEEDEDDDEADASGLGGKSGGMSSGGGGGGVKVLTFDAAGDRVGSWSEDSSDEDEEEDLWFDNMSDFDLEEDVLVGADGIGGMIPLDGDESYEINDTDADAFGMTQVSRPFDLPRSRSSRRTSAERRALAALDMDYDLTDDDEFSGDADMGELLSRGVGDGEPGSMLIVEDWDGQLVFGAGTLDGSTVAFEFATESEGDSDGQKDADRMEDLWDDDDGVADENYEGDYEGDTTDSLPDDEDDELFLPPDLYAALTATTSTTSTVAGSTGVHADSPAAIFGLPSPVDGSTNFNLAPSPPTILVEPASPHPKALSQSNGRPPIVKSPLSQPTIKTGRLAAKSQGPVMGSFMPVQASKPIISVIIDGRSKDTVTPSPFARKSSRGRGRGRGSKTDAASTRKRKDAKEPNPFSPTPTKRARYGAIPGPTHFPSYHHPSRPDSPVSSPDLPPTAEPISLEDVLDSSLLHPGTGSDSSLPSVPLAPSRWDRIPIGTFRGRARGQAATHLVGSRAGTARPLERYNPSEGKEASIFRDGSGGQEHYRMLGAGNGGVGLSPVMGPEGSGDGGAGGGKKRKRGRRESSMGGGRLKVPDFRLDG